MSRRQRRERERRRQSSTRPRVSRGRLATGAGISLAVALGAPAAAQAEDFTVTTLGDDPGTDPCEPDECSLREAVFAAEGNGTEDRILFQAGLTGTIALGGGQGHLEIDEPLEVLGPGAAALTVTADAGSRIFYVDTDPGDLVTISGLTLSGGNAASGGAVSSRYAELAIRESTISGNNASSSGGGVHLYNGTATIESSTISGNDAGFSGGGGVATLINDTTITNSTISGNDSDSNGGGLSLLDGTTTIESSTISGNEATVKGGGIYAYVGSTNPTLANTIVAGNAAPTGVDLFAGPEVSEFDAAFSLIGEPSGVAVNETVSGSNIGGQSAQLAPLADNGGPTLTMAPALTSPAVDKGSDPGPADQRGLTRPVDLPGIPNSTAAGANGADIGAVELQLPSNAFALGALKRKPKQGTATLAVEVPGAGRLALAGAKVRSVIRNPKGAATVRLLVRARGRAAKRLRRTGRVKVLAKLTYTPTAGNPRTKSRVVQLVKRKRR